MKFCSFRFSLAMQQLFLFDAQNDGRKNNEEIKLVLGF